MKDRNPVPLLVFALFMAVAALTHGCRAWPEANKDVTELRAINRVLRDHMVAKSETETAQVKTLVEKEDAILQHLQDLTR